MPKRVPTHRPPSLKRKDDRPCASKRGYGWNWRNTEGTGLADYYLKAHPYCAHCEREGLLTLATVVDHVKAHKGDKGLFWDQSNWQPLCKRCHDQKTARRDGGFGRAARPRGADGGGAV